MGKITQILLGILGIILPYFVFAEEGFIGENPGFNFYSTIDEGTYTIQKKIVTSKLQKSGTFSQFGRYCKDIKLLGSAQIDESVLEGINRGDFGPLNKLLTGKSVSTDQFQGLTSCLDQEYSRLRKDVAKDQYSRETVASIGLYMDGDKSNSDYDIIYDIEKINELIFSTEIKYNGTKNIAKKSLASLLAGNSNPSLLSQNTGGSSGSSSGGGGTSGSGNSSGGSSSNSDLSNLLGSTCSESGALGPLDISMDESFLQEFGSVMGGNTASSSSSLGYSASNNPGSSSGTKSQPTSANDFYHKIPCSGMFCIDIKTIPGGNITLGGGKNVSIEGIIDTFTKHLLPISEQSLAYQKMTNASGEMPIKNLKLWKTLGGLKVYLGNLPETTRRDKTEQTPSRDESELKAIMNCGYLSAGLPTNMAQANSIQGAGYGGRGRTTDIKSLDVKTLGVQEGVENARLYGCMNTYMREGRQTYYNSFSTDLTEIQAFTMSMNKEIREIITILAPMDNLPVK